MAFNMSGATRTVALDISKTFDTVFGILVFLTNGISGEVFHFFHLFSEIHGI